jgi:hypothetical protein
MEDQTIILIAVAILALIILSPGPCSCITEDETMEGTLRGFATMGAMGGNANANASA